MGHPVIWENNKILFLARGYDIVLTKVQCVHKKMHRRFCFISLATNILEGWDIINLNDIREPRYKQIKMGHHISKCLNIEKSCVWKSDTAAIYT